MAKQEIQKVQIASNEGNDYATIARAMLTAINACRRLQAKGVDVSKHQRSILNVEDWAHSEFKRIALS